ncbi:MULTISPECIES: hypothetical protein [unclassified Nocardioides]|uniref:restriction system modified-DNA reader domain-containing protein n=1 Tax=unclassified Nocardioides TaxID=2615069 RepID=UPI00360F844E
MSGTHDDALPITTLLPESAADPVVLFDQHAALRFAIVERDYALRISIEEWDRPGVYVLLDPPATDGSWGCYVGKAPAGVRTRLRDHLKNKDHWRRAVLVQRDTTFGFNSAQVAWLEGRLYDLLDAAEDARLHNGNRPSDETLPPFERASLEAAIVPISRVLRLIGYDPVTADDSGTVSTTTKASRTSRFVGISVKHIIDAGFLAAGTSLVSANSVWPANGSANADGTITFDGTAYPTPSAAAAAVKGTGAVNGWDFWAIEDAAGRTTLATLRARYLDSRPTT